MSAVRAIGRGLACAGFCAFNVAMNIAAIAALIICYGWSNAWRQFDATISDGYETWQ